MDTEHNGWEAKPFFNPSGHGGVGYSTKKGHQRIECCNDTAAGCHCPCCLSSHSARLCCDGDGRTRWIYIMFGLGMVSMIGFIISCLVILPAGMAAMDYSGTTTCTVIGNTGIYPVKGKECHRPELGQYLCIEINVKYATADNQVVPNQRIYAHSTQGQKGPCTMTECYVPVSEWDKSIWDLKDIKVGDGIQCMYNPMNPESVILETQFTYNQALAAIFIPLSLAIWAFFSGCGLWLCDCWCCYHFKMAKHLRNRPGAGYAGFGGGPRTY